MENTDFQEVLINGKITELPSTKYSIGSCFLYCYFVNEDGYNNTEKNWADTDGEHASIRMLTFHKAIVYLEGVIAKQKKSIEEGSLLGTDVDLYWYYTKIAPYDRLALIASHEKHLNRVLQQQANFIRMERSHYPPIWMILLRRRRRQQQNAAEATEAAISKSDHVSRDPDALLCPLLACNDEASTSYGSVGSVKTT
jgi:hypothetical protein